MSGIVGFLARSVLVVNKGNVITVPGKFVRSIGVTSEAAKVAMKKSDSMKGHFLSFEEFKKAKLRSYVDYAAEIRSSARRYCVDPNSFCEPSKVLRAYENYCCISYNSYLAEFKTINPFIF